MPIGKYPRRDSLETAPKRFYSKIRKTKRCWLWIGCKDRLGYGRMGLYGRSQPAYRVSYLIHKGNIPEGKVIMHACDNPSCVNPKHLDLGTQRENISHAYDMNPYPRKPQCPKGHLYKGIINSRGHQVCRVCAYSAQKRWLKGETK